MSKKKKQTLFETVVRMTEKVVCAHLVSLHCTSFMVFLSFQINVPIESYTFLQAISSFAYAFACERKPTEHYRSRIKRRAFRTLCSTTVEKSCIVLGFVNGGRFSPFFFIHHIIIIAKFCHRIQMSLSTFPSSSTSVDDFKWR